MKIRATHPKLIDDGDVPPYSETQAYFWIQYVHRLLSVLDNEVVVNDGKSLQSDTDVDGLSFEQFKVISRIDPSVWQVYYSQDLWESVGARLHFMNPDKKPLPNHPGLLRHISLVLSSWFTFGKEVDSDQRFDPTNF